MEERCAGCNGGIDEGLEKILKKYKGDKSNLVQVLNEVQELYGYIPLNAQKEISKQMDIPMAEIYGVITFYGRFTLKPKGRHNIAVCLGTACYVKGSQKILDKMKEKLKLEPGETTTDGKFSLEATRCIGSCCIAPVYIIDDDVYGKANVEDIDKILEKYQ